MIGGQCGSKLLVIRTVLLIVEKGLAILKVGNS